MYFLRTKQKYKSLNTFRSRGNSICESEAGFILLTVRVFSWPKAGEIFTEKTLCYWGQGSFDTASHLPWVVSVTWCILLGLIWAFTSLGCHKAIMIPSISFFPWRFTQKCWDTVPVSFLLSPIFSLKGQGETEDCLDTSPRWPFCGRSEGAGEELPAYCHEVYTRNLVIVIKAAG